MAQIRKDSNNNKFLTIAIPTYNREKQLLRLLKSIERQNAIEQYYIVVLNNHSDYDIQQLVEENFAIDFVDNIEIYNRPYNSGGDYNISSAFLFAKSDYLWIIGDDDEVLDGCIDIIQNDVQKYLEIPYFKYHIEGHSSYSNDIIVNNINQFKDLYKKKYYTAGDIIFLSNNVYNLKKVEKYIPSSLYYSYCSIPHSLPMLRCLIDEVPFVLSHKEIIRYHAPEGDHWNFIKICTSLSTILDINYKERYNVVRIFFRIISKHFEIVDFLSECLKIREKEYRKYICNRGMNTLFGGNNIYYRLCYVFYIVENVSRIKVFTGFYVKLDTMIRYRYSLLKLRLKKSDSVIYKVYKYYNKR